MLSRLLLSLLSLGIACLFVGCTAVAPNDPVYVGPFFSPRNYAGEKVLQADVRQRWQTKRGYPGMEHVVDYLTLDVSASFFPHPDRDNFGKSVAFLEYDSTWNVFFQFTRPMSFPFRNSTSSPDEHVVAGLDAAGSAQYAVMPLQFGVIACEASALAVTAVHNGSHPAVSRRPAG